MKLKGPYYRTEEFLEMADYVRWLVGNDRDLKGNLQAIRFALTREFYNSPMFAIRNFFYTASKEGDLVRMEPWPGQMTLDICMESQRRRGYPIRVIEDKPRQVGWTQWLLGRGFHAAMHPRTRVVGLVNDDDVAESLMLRVGEIYNNLPRWLRPMKRIENPKQLILDNPDQRRRDVNPGLNSLFTVTTPVSLRGLTPNFFIWSEMAFCDDKREGLTQEVFDGVIEGMASNAKSAIIIDTTPNGRDEFYWPRLKEAVERNPIWVSNWERRTPPTRDELIAGVLGEPDRPRGFVPAYTPWHWHPEYTTKDENVEGQLECMTPEELAWMASDDEGVGKRERYGGDEEIELRDRYGCSVYQLFWRRFKIDESEGNDEYEKLLKFRQEYTYRWDSGFIHFGRGAFDPRGLEKLSRWMGPGSKYGVRPPLIRGILRRDNNGHIYMDESYHADFMEVRIWALPQPGERYLMGVDTGIAYMSEKADSTIAQVFRHRDRKQVGILDCKVPLHIYREQVRLLYHWFNNAYLGIEMENDGIQLAHSLNKSGVKNQYYYRRPDRDELEEASKGLGWETGRWTVSTMQDELVSAIAAKDKNDQPEPDIIICDTKTMQELMDVTRDPDDGIIRNYSSGHDDTVVAAMIALAIGADPWYVNREKREERQKRRELNALVELVGVPPAGGGRNRPRYDQL